MPSNFLLPCSCGKQNVVHASQAGDQIVCECGTSIDVPTLGRLKSLPPAETEPVHEDSLAWGPAQGLLLCGAAILAIGLGLLGYIYINQPVPDEFDDQNVSLQLQQYTDTMSLTRSWIDWVDLRDQGLGEGVLQTVHTYQEEHKLYVRKMWIVGAIASLGLILTVGGVIWNVLRPSSGTTSPQ